MADVLLIEDDDAQRFVAAFALKKAGHAVREAADGPAGLAAAREAQPDLIVCDVMMPGMTGYDVLAELRADAALATVPVVLLTAMSDRKHMRQGMTAGADDYLTKPYRPDELCEAVQVLLSRRQAQEEAFRHSLSGALESALEQQKETLSKQYENRLLQEVNARWTQAQVASDLHYPRACVLLADLLGPGEPRGDDAALAERVRQAQQAARDTLYLFRVTHVLPYGTKLMAVFSGDDATVTTSSELRALRAAVALVKGAAPERPITVALHTGALALVALNDGLHGDQGHALVPGDTVATVAGVEALGLQSGWRIAASEAMARALGGEANFGRSGTTSRGDLAVEVQGLAPLEPGAGGRAE